MRILKTSLVVVAAGLVVSAFAACSSDATTDATGGTGGTGGASAGSGGTTSIAGKGGSATGGGSAEAGAAGAAATCAITDGPCVPCIASKCSMQFGACNADPACSQALSVGLFNCVCVEMKSTMECATDFAGTGTKAAATAQCAGAKCATECGL